MVLGHEIGCGRFCVSFCTEMMFRPLQQPQVSMDNFPNIDNINSNNTLPSVPVFIHPREVSGFPISERVLRIIKLLLIESVKTFAIYAGGERDNRTPELGTFNKFFNYSLIILDVLT